MAGRKRTKTSGTPASIREALKKATTEMLVLYVLRRKSMYTYEMMQEIDRMSRRRPDSEPRRSQASGGVFLRCWQCR